MSLSVCNNYIVYKHTSPSNKVYIGITKFDPKYRWLNNGRGYRNQTIFFNAIFSSLNDAYKYINRVNKGGITSVCTGNRDSYVGYKWRFRYEN